MYKRDEHHELQLAKQPLYSAFATKRPNGLSRMALGDKKLQNWVFHDVTQLPRSWNAISLLLQLRKSSRVVVFPLSRDSRDEQSSVIHYYPGTPKITETTNDGNSQLKSCVLESLRYKGFYDSIKSDEIS